MDYLAAIRAFVRSVDLGSFSRAAAEAGVKVSTVSRYVSGLEADLGAALLNRSTRSLHLTEAGRMFYERGAQISRRCPGRALFYGIAERAAGPHLLRNTRACARGHPRLAMPDRKLVMPSFGIEMRDRSPQSRPAGWPAAGLRVNATPGSWTAGFRRSGAGQRCRRSKWSTCNYTSILLGSVEIAH